MNENLKIALIITSEVEQIYGHTRKPFILVSFTLKNQSEFHLLTPTTLKRHTINIYIHF